MRTNFVVAGVATGIRRNLSMTAALVLSTAIALAFVGAALLANREITLFRTAYESKLNVSIYMCEPLSRAPCHGQYTSDQRQSVAAALTADPDVVSYTYLDESEALKRAKQILPKLQAEQAVKGDVPASFTVKLKDIKNDYTRFAAKFAVLTGVAGVQNQIETIRSLLDIIDGARTFSIVIALVVLVASVLLISNTIQVAAAQRRNETSIMRLVGASRWMTELPFMLETIVAAFVGGLIAFGMVYFGKTYVLNDLFQPQVENRVIPNLTTNDVIVNSAYGLFAGIVLAALTAFATLRLYVKL